VALDIKLTLKEDKQSIEFDEIEPSLIQSEDKFFKNELRSLMWNCAGIIRSEKKIDKSFE